jgi:hypothetical protein
MVRLLFFRTMATVHEVAIRLLDHVTEVNATAKQSLTFRRKTGSTPIHAVLDRDRIPRGVNDAAEFDKNAAASSLGDVAVTNRHRRIDKISSESTQPGYGALFAACREATIPRNIRSQNRGELEGLSHCT